MLWTAAIPALCLQPLVENAFKHGLELTPGPLQLVLRARGDADALIIEVADNGPGPGEAPIQDGLGLGNSRARLDAQFGRTATLALRHESGCVARIQLPLSFI